jgi:hypothetical protein
MPTSGRQFKVYLEFWADALSWSLTPALPAQLQVLYERAALGDTYATITVSCRVLHCTTI